ncbi:MAG: polyisoprenoid-binding protein [Betaproteobacteria bacterium]|nr:polyisoprenoid-binding protein [Betaproteobacteria bacterium]
MKKVLAMSIAMMTGSAAYAADSYTIDSRHTFPSFFEVSHLGFSTQRGRFNGTKGKIVLDRKLKTGSIDVTIATTTLDTGFDKLEEHLRGVDFFNTEIYPAMTFKADKITYNGDAPSKIDGEVTLLGVPKPLTLSLVHFRCGIHPMLKKEVCGANASGTLKRSEFGMKYAVPAVGDEVKILIQVEAIKD